MEEGYVLDYVNKLVSFGYARVCAERLVKSYIDDGKEEDLADYIATKDDIGGNYNV